MDEEIEKIKNERKLTPRGEFEYLVYGTQGHRADRGGVSDVFWDAAARGIASREAKPQAAGPSWRQFLKVTV